MEKPRDISEQVDYRLCIRIETGKVRTNDFQFKQNHAKLQRSRTEKGYPKPKD